VRRLLSLLVVFTCFALVWLAQPRRDYSQRAPKNLVLVIACTLRADQTSVGSALDTTPTLARWAREGANIRQLIAAAPWTRAASTGLLTGLPPSTVGLSEPGPGANDRALPEGVTTLAEVLDTAGWETLGATANPNLNAAFQFDQGFDQYESMTGLWRHSGVVKVPGTEVNRAAARLLDRADPTKPTYLQLVYVDSHAPLDASPAESTRFALPGLPEQVAAYRGLVRRLDTRLAELEDILAARGLTQENTILAVVADHGEGLLFPRHHGMGHGLYLYPSTLHVPFVVRGPGVPPGTEVDGLVSGLDVAATLAELVGETFPGMSHADAIRRGDPTQRTEAMAATWFRNAHRGAIYTEELACLRDFTPDVPAHPTAKKPPFPTACFDRSSADFDRATRADPALMERLETWFREEERRLGAAATEAGDVDHQLREALEALGYAISDPTE
jgi:arylsulfatase